MSTKRRPAKAPAPPPRSEKLVVWLKPGLLIMVAISLLVWGFKQLQDPNVMPVRTVGVDGEMRFIKREHLEQVVAEAVNGSFFSLDLQRMQGRIERMPWVAQASVRRIWPDTLRVQVTERSPLAYWGKEAMISRQGEVFEPQVLPRLDGLVTLVGERQHAKTITREYQRMHTLLETAGLRLTHVWVDARQAWRIKTDSGLLLQLGRRDVIPRLTRFVQLYPDLLAQQGRQPETVDLRYTNGFTVDWRQDDEKAPQGDRQVMGFDRGDSVFDSMEYHHILRITG
jgi:cell division protein FtsQ